MAFFHDAELSAAGARVGGDFFGRRADRAAADPAEVGGSGLAQLGDIQGSRACVAAGAGVAELLDLAVFEGMESDDSEPAAGGDASPEGGQAPLELGELVVDMESKAEKHAGGRVGAVSAAGLEAFDEAGELPGGIEGIAAALGVDGAGDRSGSRFAAEAAEDADQFAERRIADDGGGGEGLVAIHAHVQGAIVQEAETALGVIDHGGAEAEVGEDAIARLWFNPLVHLIKGHVAQFEAAREWGEPLRGGVNRRAIAIASKQPARRCAGFQNGSRVSSPTDGGVEIAFLRLRGQVLHRLAEEH